MTQPVLDIKSIMRRLPHRPPFLLIDRVFRYGGDDVLALKNVTLNEAFFGGHFPGEPIMPGVMIGECMAQAAGFFGIGDEDVAAFSEPDARCIGAKAFLSTITLKLEKPVVPGDQLLVAARVLKRLGKVMRVSATATVEDQRVATAEFTVVIP